jgi:cell fate regulator YaaT (PSP1 superfamily)
MAKNDKSKQNHMLVRYGNIGYLGLFEHNLTELPLTPTRVVIKTERGLELGTLIGAVNSKKGDFCLNCNSLEEYYETQPGEYPLGREGKFVRIANEQDLSEEKHINNNAKNEMKRCQEFAKELGLQMKVVDCEHIFGGERIVFYFLSDGRVDFRELVKRLAREFQTRIEMRQIGARDEARLISDIETCGQPCCCRQFLKILKPVNMRMAKVQKATLDPSKISGHCGRLRCCLRYEDETYTHLKKRLPNRSARVQTPMGTGQVIDVQIITQLVSVRHEDGMVHAFNVEDITVLPKSEGYEQKNAAQNTKNGSGSSAKKESKRQVETARETQAADPDEQAESDSTDRTGKESESPLPGKNPQTGGCDDTADQDNNDRDITQDATDDSSDTDRQEVGL